MVWNLNSFDDSCLQAADTRLACVRRLQDLADLLDASFSVTGTNWRFVLDPLLGLVRGIGEALSRCVSLYMVFMSWRLRARGGTRMCVFGRISVDAVLGVHPVVG